MKRLICGVILLVLFGFSGCSAHRKEAQDIFKQGTVHDGFRVTKTAEIGYLCADVYFLEHEKSGAQLIYCDCDDIERTFCVSFRTQAINDKGLPHVFEHSAVAGSQRYPDPNLLFGMSTQTYNTYLNAETWQNVTIYPCASQSEEQLLAYMDVYMSGVLEPLIVTEERSMMREAYHYALASPDDELTVSGIVYSEMQGAAGNIYSDADLKTRKLLFPGSYSANLSGGLPSEILNIEYQELLDFHEKYYHPSNMLMMLYGKLEDPERYLKFLNKEYLSNYDRKDVMLDDPEYERAEGFREANYTFAASADTDAEDASLLTYAFELDGLSYQDTVAATVVSTYLSSDSSPLLKAMNERFPAAAFSVSLNDMLAKPVMILQLDGANPEDAPLFRETADTVLQDMVGQEIDQSVVEMLVNSLRYSQILANETEDSGVELCRTFARAWAFGGETDAYLKSLDSMEQIGSFCQDDSITNFISDYMLNSANTVLTSDTPEPGELEAENARELKRLQEMKAAMTDAEISALVEKTADYDAWIAKNDTVSLVDKVQKVKASKLPEEYPTAAVNDRTENDVRYITSELESDEIFAVNIYLDASYLPFELLNYADTLTILAGTMGTEHYTAEEFLRRLQSETQNIGMTLAPLYYQDQPEKLYLCLNISGLSEQIESSFELLEELLLYSKFDDHNEIRTSAAGDANLLDLFLQLQPETAVQALVDARMNPAHAYELYLAFSSEYAAYINGVAAMSDAELDTYSKQLYQAREYLMNRKGAIVAAVGDSGNLDLCLKKADALLDKLEAKTGKAEDIFSKLPKLGDNVALCIPGTVQYDYQCLNFEDAGIEANGKLYAVNKLVLDKVLYPEIRFRNNAYSAQCKCMDTYIYMDSYRDPNVQETYDIFSQVGERLRTMDITQEELDGYIIAAYSGLAGKQGPVTQALNAVESCMLGSKEGERMQRYIQELKQLKTEDLQELSAVYDLISSKGARVAGVSETLIDQNAGLFDQILKIEAQ